MRKLDRIIALNKEIKACRKCQGLNRKGETENAPGYGNVKSKVMLIGQSLCTQCIDTQIPFTGGSGKILDAVFKELGIKKSDIFITNAVHCHPPGNRPSEEHEVKNCSLFLGQEIEIVRPRLIITLGRDAMEALIHNGTGKFSKYKVITYWGRGYTVYPMYHPAYYYRKGGVDAAKEYIEEMARIIKKWR